MNNNMENKTLQHAGEYPPPSYMYIQRRFRFTTSHRHNIYVIIYFSRHSHRILKPLSCQNASTEYMQNTRNKNLTTPNINWQYTFMQERLHVSRIFAKLFFAWNDLQNFHQDMCRDKFRPTSIWKKAERKKAHMFAVANEKWCSPQIDAINV